MMMSSSCQFPLVLIALAIAAGQGQSVKVVFRNWELNSLELSLEKQNSLTVDNNVVVRRRTPYFQTDLPLVKWIIDPAINVIHTENGSLCMRPNQNAVFTLVQCDGTTDSYYYDNGDAKSIAFGKTADGIPQQLAVMEDAAAPYTEGDFSRLVAKPFDLFKSDGNAQFVAQAQSE